MNFLKKIPPGAVALLFFFIATIIVSGLRVVNNYELEFYDLRFRLRPTLPASDQIAIIEIDDTTLANLNTWPISRDFHAILVDVLTQAGARAVVFDMFFDEPTLDDEPFIQSIYENGSVYAGLAFLNLSRPRGVGFPVSDEVLGQNRDDIQEVLRGEGHINVTIGPDGKYRSIPLFIQYQDSLTPHLGLRVAAEALGIDCSKAVLRHGSVRIDNKLTIPVSSQGEFMINYPGKWDKTFARYSYLKILKAYRDSEKGLTPELDLSRLKDKICFIGLTAVGTHDLRANPLENNYPMLGLQASVCRSVLTGQFIRDVGAGVNTLINIFIFVCSLLISSQKNFVRSLLGCVGMGIAYFLLSVVLFSGAGIWIDLFLPLGIIILSWVGMTVYKLFDQPRRRQLLEKELDIARQIQQSFLPADIGDFAGIDIFTFMKPAKFVGGDLYDTIRLDEHRLGVFIGDVSGKGVPAALIMAQTITLFRIFAKQHNDPAAVLIRMNQELSRVLNGRFVTALYLIIDRSNYSLLAACAGHSPIIFFNVANEKVDEFLPDSGLPLGVMEAAEYTSFCRPLAEGDKFLLYTDGVTEARDHKGEEFGEERMKEALLKNRALSSKGIIDVLQANLFQFSRGLPQFDDITIIILALVRDL